MESREKFKRTFEKLEKAFRKFAEIIRQPSLFDYLSEELIVEVATKRFEYTFESLWKTIKEYLRIEGLLCATPLQCFKEAFKRGIIDEKYEELFLEMIEKRNQVVHIYGFEEARVVYQFIKKDDVYLAIDSAYKKLKDS
ncbi:MAG: HI0074 family nucleotidyltransferase substrate-binding subunit [Nanoarchaeota archaeon]|nr:HI0074 family nucleotidyltransferase substrate-binding subunit [Nanoarchaeota archaeon]